jgi:hypothetical protein
VRAGLIVLVGFGLSIGSCIVPIEDVEDDQGSGGSAGSGGTAGTTGGSAGAGGGWTGGTGASGGTSGSGGDASAGAAGTGGSGGAAGSSGGAGGSAGAAGSGGGPGCVVNVSDDFNDGSIGSIWTKFTNNTSIQISETGGELRLVMPSVSSAAFAGLQTDTIYDLTGCSTFVHVTDLLDPATKAYVNFVVRSGNNYVEILKTANDLQTKRWVDGSASYLVTLPFNATLHAWWRFRESGGAIYFEASKDGISYAQITSTSAPFDPKQVRMQLGVAAYQAELNPGDASFDNFNVPPAM